MKRWIVSALFLGNSNVGERWSTQTRSRLKMFLWYREYSIEYLADDGIVIAPNGAKFDIKVDYNPVDRTATVSVTSENWEPVPKSKGDYAQAVVLLEDFFKLQHKTWYHLETLTLPEIGAINEHGRSIFPIQIKQELDKWTDENLPTKPEVGFIGEYNHQAYHIYYGQKSVYSSQLDFWVACLSWVDCDGIDLNNYSAFNDTHYYEHHLGACIPSSRTDKDEYLKEIEQHVPNVKTDTLKSVYLMGKDWNDRKFLFEFDDLYVLHYWFTHE